MHFSASPVVGHAIAEAVLGGDKNEEFREEYKEVCLMGIKFDQYSLSARIMPVYLTIAPLAIVIIAVLPENLNLSIGGGASLILVPLAFLASQIGADYGKQLEKNLWKNWDGPPTTRFLRHSNHEYNQIARERVHAKLRAIGLNIPTEQEEQQNREKADELFESCTLELIRRTRDYKRFPLVFKGLTEYGFRRNMLGLKPIGLPLASTALIICGWNIYRIWDTSKVTALAIIVALLATTLLFTWVFWVNAKTVKMAAERYARFLLEAALDME